MYFGKRYNLRVFGVWGEGSDLGLFYKGKKALPTQPISVTIHIVWKIFFFSVDVCLSWWRTYTCWRLFGLCWLTRTCWRLCGLRWRTYTCWRLSGLLWVDDVPILVDVCVVCAENDEPVVPGGGVLDPVQQGHVLALPTKQILLLQFIFYFLFFAINNFSFIRHYFFYLPLLPLSSPLPSPSQKNYWP